MSNPNYIEPPNHATFYSGPPPEVGWWPASTDEYPQNLRYWNGKVWSESVRSSADAETAGMMALMISPYSEIIKWTHRWWEKKAEPAPEKPEPRFPMYRVCCWPQDNPYLIIAYSEQDLLMIERNLNNSNSGIKVKYLTDWTPY